MSEFSYRTEDIRPEDILKLFVPTSEERISVDQLKSPNPVILEGSRGTGKSFLMKVAEQELLESFEKNRVIPVYLSFVRSSLLQSSDPHQFRNWMLSKLCGKVIRALRAQGILVPPSAMNLLNGGKTTAQPSVHDPLRIEEIASKYEMSWKQTGSHIDSSAVPDVDDLKDTLEDICTEMGITRFCILFDEAAHVFRPEQQRQFFTLFRDLRSPYITCNAAVYPGVTSYGPTFQLAHDATLRRVERDVSHTDYLQNMREIVMRQADPNLQTAIDKNRDNFDALAYAVSGNPRFLLKTTARCPKMRSTDVSETIKQFFRTEIWTEHSGLADTYPGHRALIDWGREFIESTVLPETQKKNQQRSTDGKNESTCYFWVHRDTPQPIKEALRLLCYVGVAQKMDDGVRATRAGIGTRYALNLGCIFALEANPINVGLQIARSLSIKRFTEFGSAHQAFQSLGAFDGYLDPDMSQALAVQLQRTIDCLDISGWQSTQLKQVGFNTVGDVLNADENELMEKILYVGEKRARQIKNAAIAAMLEYLSG